MIPAVLKGNMNQLTESAQKRICKHKPMCKHFVSIDRYDSGFMLCGQDAEKFFVGGLKQLGLAIGSPTVRRTTCTIAEEEKIISMVKEIGCYGRGHLKKGTFQIIADELGMSRNQIRHTVDRLRKEGRL